MLTTIVYSNEDGAVSIVTPAPEARRRVLVAPAQFRTVTIEATDEEPERQEQELVTPEQWRDETDAEFIAWVAAKDVPPNADGSARPFILTDTPPDSTFLGAWELHDGVLSPNISKAKDIQRKRWVRIAEAKIATLSKDYVSALLSQDTTLQAEITAKVQALRKVTDTMLPDDLESIASTMPEILIN